MKIPDTWVSRQERLEAKLDMNDLVEKGIDSKKIQKGYGDL